ncbi:MAG: hypothetical protein JKY43_05720 [Phycisphaerales bacterium]|nr:hypothetical protein [Phycisphaerales bacterium]
MEKRTVIFGTPACVFWRSVLAGVVFVILLCSVVVGIGFMALSGVMQMVNSNTNPGGFFFWYWGAVFGVFVVWWWLSSSSRRFRRRFVKFDG